MARERRIVYGRDDLEGAIMRNSFWLAGGLALFCAGSGQCDPEHSFNAVDFVVPADELDAAAVGEAAVHAGFLPLPESDARLKALRNAPDPTYEIWELPSHKVATISMTKLRKTGGFVVLFVAKDQSKPHASLSGEACKKWLKFSGAMRVEFPKQQQSKFRFRNPQCEP
jgi:hypothetical protein